MTSSCTAFLKGALVAALALGGPSSLVETYDDWSVVCQMQAEAPACIVRQIQTNTQTRQAVLTMEIGNAVAGQFQSMLLLPLGLALPQGAQLTIDEAAFGSALPFSTCLQQGCLVPVTFVADTIAKLRAGKALTITVNRHRRPSPSRLQFPSRVSPARSIAWPSSRNSGRGLQVASHYYRPRARRLRADTRSCLRYVRMAPKRPSCGDFMRPLRSRSDRNRFQATRAV